MKDLLTKYIAQLLNHLLVGLMAYGLNISPLEASILLGIVDQHYEN